MKYKFVACDMDGTLLSSGYRVSKKNVETINRYMEEGGIFTVATGRNFHSAVMCLKELKITAPVICFHGSLIADIKTAEPVREFALAANDSLGLLEFLRERGIYTQIYIRDLMFTERETAITKWYHKVCGVKAITTGQPLSEFVKKDQRAMLKILAVTDPANSRELIKETNAMFGSKINASQSRADFVEFSSKSSDKSVAADYVLKSYGLKRSDMLALGDAMNDIPMLKTAGFAVAMGNADADVKQIAHFVTDTNDNDGVAKAIEQFCLN